MNDDPTEFSTSQRDGSASLPLLREADGAAIQQRIDHFRAHPQFFSWLIDLSAELIAVYETNPRMGKLLASHRRWFMVQLGYAMATARRMDPTDEGLTASRMTALMERLGLASRNTVTNFLAELRAYKFVADLPGHKGRRSRPIEPTSLGEAGMAKWMNVNLACLDRFDGGDRVVRLNGSPRLMAATQARAARELMGQPDWFNPHALAQVFVNMDTGGLILDGLTTRLKNDDRRDGAVAMGRINISAMARKFMISRVHLDRIMRRAEELGAVCRFEDGSYGLSEELVLAQERRHALKLAVLDEALNQATRNPDEKIDLFA